MKVWKYYLLWTTRTGRRYWRGPYDNEKDAWGNAPIATNVDAARIFVLPRSVEEV